MILARRRLCNLSTKLFCVITIDCENNAEGSLLIDKLSSGLKSFLKQFHLGMSNSRRRDDTIVVYVPHYQTIVCIFIKFYQTIIRSPALEFLSTPPHLFLFSSHDARPLPLYPVLSPHADVTSC